MVPAALFVGRWSAPDRRRWRSSSLVVLRAGSARSPASRGGWRARPSGRSATWSARLTFPLDPSGSPGRIRCRDPLETGDGERLVAFHRDVEVHGRWALAQRRAHARDALVRAVGPRRLAHASIRREAAEPLITIPKVWRGRRRRAQGAACRLPAARLAERHGPATRGARRDADDQRHRSTARGRARRARRRRATSASAPRMAATSISTVALDDAMRLLGGRNRRAAASAGVVGLGRRSGARRHRRRSGRRRGRHDPAEVPPPGYERGIVARDFPFLASAARFLPKAPFGPDGAAWEPRRESVVPRDDADALLTVAQAATLLGVHPNTIRRWTDAGRLTAYRINARGDRRFRRGDVVRLLVEVGSADDAGAVPSDVDPRTVCARARDLPARSRSASPPRRRRPRWPVRSIEALRTEARRRPSGDLRHRRAATLRAGRPCRLRPSSARRTRARPDRRRHRRGRASRAALHAARTGRAPRPRRPRRPPGSRRQFRALAGRDARHLAGQRRRSWAAPGARSAAREHCAAS